MSDFIHAPVNAEEAESLIQALCNNPTRIAGPLQQSLRHWDRNGAGLIARAAKSCYYYQHGNALGVMLRTLANTAIIIEHRRAQQSAVLA
jgi:hypothetical protein